MPEDVIPVPPHVTPPICVELRSTVATARDGVVCGGELWCAPRRKLMCAHLGPVAPTCGLLEPHPRVHTSGHGCRTGPPTASPAWCGWTRPCCGYLQTCQTGRAGRRQICPAAAPSRRVVAPSHTPASRACACDHVQNAQTCCQQALHMVGVYDPCVCSRLSSHSQRCALYLFRCPHPTSTKRGRGAARNRATCCCTLRRGRAQC